MITIIESVRAHVQRSEQPADQPLGSHSRRFIFLTFTAMFLLINMIVIFITLISPSLLKSELRTAALRPAGRAREQNQPTAPQLLSSVDQRAAGCRSRGTELEAKAQPHELRQSSNITIVFRRWFSAVAGSSE